MADHNPPPYNKLKEYPVENVSSVTASEEPQQESTELVAGAAVHSSSICVQVPSNDNTPGTIRSTPSSTHNVGTLHRPVYGCSDSHINEPRANSGSNGIPVNQQTLEMQSRGLLRYNTDHVNMNLEAGRQQVAGNRQQMSSTMNGQMSSEWNQYYSDTKRQSEVDPLRWDVTILDKALYFLLPIILLKCGFILLFVMPPLEPPRLSASCWTPAEFSGTWTDYTNRYCLSQQSTLYRPLTEEIPEHDERPDVLDFADDFNQKVYPSPPVAYNLFVMAVLCLMPIAIWKGMSIVDATELIMRDSRYGHRLRTEDQALPTILRRADFMQTAGFVGSKLFAAGIGLILVIMIAVMNEQARLYVLQSEEYNTPKDELALCDFSIRRLGDNLHRYTVQCVISSQRDELSLLWMLLDVGHIIMPLIRAATVLVFLTFLAQALNAAVITVTFLKSFSPQFRQFVIARYADSQDGNVCSIMDQMIGPAGVFVTLMSVRCGESQRVLEIYATVAEKARVELEKRD